MKNCILAVGFLLLQHTIHAQVWTPLGSNEQSNNSIANTAAFALYLQSSQDGVPHFSFIDDASGDHNVLDFKIHVQKFNGTQWIDIGAAATPEFPSSDFFPIAFDNNTLYMAYSEPTGGATSQKMSVKKWTGTNWQLVGNAGFSTGDINNLGIAVSNGKVYAAYADNGLGGKLTVKMFDNANAAAGWQTLGAQGFSFGVIYPMVGSSIKLAIDNNVPYVAYTDMGVGLGSVVVKKWTGLQWQTVGTNDASDNHMGIGVQLAFNSLHEPYIAYVDATDNSKGFVRKLNASNEWVTVSGQPVASTGVQTIVSLHMFHDIPVAGFGVNNASNISQAQVKIFNVHTNGWESVGTQPLSASTSSVTNVEVSSDHNHKLFVIYHNFNGGIYAKTFDASAVLPVDLLSFTAVKQRSNSVLQWATVNERQHKHFEVEQSTDGIHFIQLATVLADGNSTTHQYSFVHTTPAKAVNYYRLKQVDVDGSFTYSSVVSLDWSEHATIHVNISPNPVKQVLHVQHTLKDVKQAVIRTTDGRVVKQLNVSATTVDIPVQELVAGSYVLYLYGANGQLATSTFIK